MCELAHSCLVAAGDYWPGEAENLLTNLSELSRQTGKKNSKPGRAAKGTKGKRYGSEPATTDSQLMDKLGDALQGMKADFIVVHLQEPCSFCRQYISDGTRWVLAAFPCLSPLWQEWLSLKQFRECLHQTERSNYSQISFKQ